MRSVSVVLPHLFVHLSMTILLLIVLSLMVAASHSAAVCAADFFASSIRASVQPSSISLLMAPCVKAWSPMRYDFANDCSADDTAASCLACLRWTFFAASPCILSCSSVLPTSRAKSVSPNSRRIRGNCVLRYLWKRVAASTNSCSAMVSWYAIREKKGQSGLFGPSLSFASGAPYDTSFRMMVWTVCVVMLILQPPWVVHNCGARWRCRGNQTLL